MVVLEMVRYWWCCGSYDGGGGFDDGGCGGGGAIDGSVEQEKNPHGDY